MTTYEPFSQHGIPEPPEGAVFEGFSFPCNAPARAYFNIGNGKLWNCDVPPSIADRVVGCKFLLDTASDNHLTDKSGCHFVLQEKKS